MHTLSQSPFLQALGYAIANSLWQIALLWLAVLLLTGIFKFSSPAKYKIALYAQFAGFAWFIITLQFYYTQCSSALSQTSALRNPADASFFTTSSNDFHALLLNGVLKGQQLLPYLSLAYLLLLVFLSVKWIRNYRFAQYIKTEGLQKPGVQWKLFVSRISSLLNIKSKVTIYLSALVKSPLTVGFLKPVILIPIASINHLTTEQLEAVILHELAHIKRADYLINLFQSVIEIALFFNPFSQLLSKLIRKERENSCDDWVLQFQYNPSMYADALLRIAYLQTSPALLMQAAGRKGDLLSRVKRMVDKNEQVFNYRQQLLALLLMTGILSAVAWLQPSAKNTIAIAAAGTTRQTPPPPSPKVDNPWFDPAFFLSTPMKEEFSKAMDDASKEIADGHADLNDAKGEFAKMIPAATEELKKAAVENGLQLALKTIKDSMQDIAMVENQLNAVTKNKNLVDTALIGSSLRGAYAQMKQLDLQKIIRQSLAGAKKQMLKMEKDQNLQLFLKDKEKKALAGALNMFNSKQSMLMPPPPPPAVAPPPPGMSFPPKKELDKAKMLLELMKLKQLKLYMDSINQTADGNGFQNNFNQNWSFSYPVYIEQSDDDTAKNFTFTVSDNSIDTVFVAQNSLYINNAKSEQSKAQYTPPPQQQTINITKTAGSKSVNLQILIL